MCYIFFFFFFFAENYEGLCTHIFLAKTGSVFMYNIFDNFNVPLTKDIVSFEQLGPGC